MVILSGDTQTGFTHEYPNHFIPRAKKKKEDWIKSAMDYYAHIATVQYTHNDWMRKNIRLMQGEFDFSDFMGDPEVEDLADALTKGAGMPVALQHFSIINAPLNTMVGELRSKQDRHRLYAYDEESISEKNRAKSEMLFQSASAQVRRRVFDQARQRAGQQAQDMMQQAEAEMQAQLQAITGAAQARAAQEANADPEAAAAQLQAEFQGVQAQIQQRLQGQLAQLDAQSQEQAESEFMSLPQIEEHMVKTYQNAGEQYGNKRLKYMKRHFMLREKSLTAFEHYFGTGKFFFHTFLSNTPVGFDTEVVNPANVFHSVPVEANYDGKQTQDFEYIGIARFMDISTLIERHKLDQKEIDQLQSELRDGTTGYHLAGSDNRGTGSGSVAYRHRDWAAEQREGRATEQNLWGNNSAAAQPGANPGAGYGREVFTVQVYCKSKRKVGKLTYTDESGLPQVEVVDESYVFSPADGDIAIEWEWINEWMQGTKIGKSIYKDVMPLAFAAHKPFNYKPFCPIVGRVDYKAALEYLKPYQAGYNICLNQVFDLLEKEIGVVALMNLRHLNGWKDNGGEDAVEKTVAIARQSGLLGVTDDPKNMKGGPSAFSAWQKMDLSLSGQIASRIELAQFFKNEGWSLLGFSPQRLSQITPSETAAGIEQALGQSFAQTMRYFTNLDTGVVRHYELLVNVALYVETYTGKTTLSYLASDMDSAFLKLNQGRQLLTELGIEMTSAPDEEKTMRSLQSLWQPMLQNGADALDVARLQSSESVSQMIDVLEKSRNRREKKEGQEMAMREREMAQAKEIQAEQLAYAKKKDEDGFANAIEVAQIRSLGFAKNQDSDANAVPDALEIGKFNDQSQRNQAEVGIKQQKLLNDRLKMSQKTFTDQQKLQVQREAVQVQREALATQERIAAQNKTRAELEAEGRVPAEE